VLAQALSFEQSAVRGIYNSDRGLPGETVEFLAGFDRIVSFLGGIDDAVLMNLSMVQGVQVFAIDPRPRSEAPLRGRHITQQWIDQLAAHGYRPEVIPARLQISPSRRRANCDMLAARLDGKPGRMAICHPGSGSLKKCCPIEACEQLVEAAESSGWNVGWMIGPDEVERFGPSYVERLEHAAPVIYEESVEIAANLVSGAEGYIGHDAGMTHVAVLAGVPTVALFGPTDPQVWRPLGDTCRVIGFPPEGGPLDPWIREVLLHLSQSDHTPQDDSVPTAT
jgi:ADP-heptose:LPS heptosyltransferase